VTKYTGTGLVATFGSVVFGCITGAEFNQTAQVYTASCAGSSYQVKVVGPINATATVNYLLDTADKTVVTGLVPGTTGTFTMSTSGTVGPMYSMAAIVESSNQSIPVDNIASGTVTFGADGAVTIT